MNCLISDGSFTIKSIMWQTEPGAANLFLEQSETG